MNLADQELIRPYAQLCAAFTENNSSREAGGFTQVKHEIETYWQTGGSFAPLAVFSMLIDARVENGKISPECGKYLKDYLAESYAPEHTTGYAEKHREQLTTDFARAYTQAMATQGKQVFRVGADVMNLGGLNAAIEAYFGPGREKEARALADRVVLVMTNILRSHLELVGPLVPIRSGGDELTLYVQADSGTGETRVARAIRDAEKEIAAFINEAGLEVVGHMKRGEDAGVGIGCGMTPLRAGDGQLLSDVALVSRLSETISEQKKAFRDMLYTRYSVPAKTAGKHAVLRTERLDAAFRSFERYAQPPRHMPRLLAEDADFSGSTPEVARLRRAERGMPTQRAQHTLEQHVLETVLALTEKRDHVTNLAQFAAIDRIMAPNFKQEHGANARLVHIDFNNMAGGNNLGPWVGDAMARVFTTCIQEALEDPALHLDAFEDYLTSHGGGKFTLLLPAGKADTQMVQKLSDLIEAKLAKHSTESLGLTDEQIRYTRPLLFRQANEEFDRRSEHGWQEGDSRGILLNPEYITLADINHTKSLRQGSRVVTVSRELDLNETPSVIEAVKSLEHKARGGQAAIGSWEERHAGIKKRRAEAAGGFAANLVQSAGGARER